MKARFRAGPWGNHSMQYAVRQHANVTHKTRYPRDTTINNLLPEGGCSSDLMGSAMRPTNKIAGLLRCRMANRNGSSARKTRTGSELSQTPESLIATVFAAA